MEPIIVVFYGEILQDTSYRVKRGLNRNSVWASVSAYAYKLEAKSFKTESALKGKYIFMMSMF